MKFRKFVNIYKDAKQSEEARFMFEGVLEQLEIPRDQWEDIHTLKLEVTDYVENPSTIQSH